MEDFRQRAARQVPDDDLRFGPVTVTGDERPLIRFRPELGYSSKPLVGAAITGIKRTTLRMLFHVFDALARDVDHAVHALWNRSEEARRRLTAVEGVAFEAEAVRERLADSLAAETSARERVQADLEEIALRLTQTQDDLQRLQLGPRLARLERQRRTAPSTAAASPSDAAVPTPAVPSAPEPSGFDYERFEDRFRPREQVLAHQVQYVELLADAERVLDIGCGRGELVGMLRDRGVDAYGYELEPDFVSMAEEASLPVSLGDGIAHLAGCEPESLDGVVSSHVVEHLEPAQVLALVNGAAAALRPGGVLIMETPNPESLVAGSVNFHRDLTHRRPIHPDTLAFLCESSGFGEVEVRRLSPVDEASRLPDPDDGSPLSDTIKRLNALLYGYQDYAVIARKP